ncbi:polysaccharide deacetylase family protein [Zafaria sp. Z1313]|uniref:polysaccharide deacetylase family protein n=1 Tax=Zafaria sp. Z1313 TaxID=3423202 RepID=UPI003D30366B
MTEPTSRRRGVWRVPLLILTVLLVAVMAVPVAVTLFPALAGDSGEPAAAGPSPSTRLAGGQKRATTEPDPVGLARQVPLTSAGLPVDGSTVVSLTFDDGTKDQLIAAEVMERHGLQGTFFVNSGSTGFDGYLDLEDLNRLYAAGHELGGHGYQHVELDKVPVDEAARQICLDRAMLMGWGFRTTSFAYPNAASTQGVRDAAEECGYNTARGLGGTATDFSCGACPTAEKLVPDEPFLTKAPQMVNEDWTLEDLKAPVLGAEANGGGWVQMTFHTVCEGSCGGISVDPQVFEEYMAWLKEREARGTIVRTVDEVVGGEEKAAVDGPDPSVPDTGSAGVVNPGLEMLDNEAYPVCWEAAGYGKNTASFTRVSPGLRGDTAYRVTVADHVDGDAKLLLRMDLGECSPIVEPGHSYTLRTHYQGTGDPQFVVYLRTVDGRWDYWQASPFFRASDKVREAVWTTPVIPEGHTAISFGLALVEEGSIVTDDYALTSNGELSANGNGWLRPPAFLRDALGTLTGSTGS